MALINVKTEFNKADILIYTSTIEAGVNYDEIRFYKLYGVFVENTTSQRAFNQMSNRIRQFECNDILILCEKLKYNQMKFFTFDEIKTNILNSKYTDNRIYDKKIVTINNVSKEIKQLNLYGINYCYNLLEQRNKHKSLFLYYFEILAIHKGHDITIDVKELEIDDEEKAIIKKLNDAKSSMKNNDIINAYDIKPEQLKLYYQDQNKHKLNESAKNALVKDNFKKKLGVDELDDKILDNFGSLNKITNFINIIDIKNYKKETDDNLGMYMERINIINTLIADFGFKNVFDNKILKLDEFEEKMEYIKENNDLFKNNNIRCKLKKLKVGNNFTSAKAFLGLLNSIFEEYGFKIVSCKVQDNGIRSQNYKLAILDGIKELIFYKIKKGFNLVDSNNLFNYKFDEKKSKFSHLILIN
jgi:hypothetical protein